MNTFHAPFLTDLQVEELMTFGMVELTDDMMEAWASWAGEAEEPEAN